MTEIASSSWLAPLVLFCLLPPACLGAQVCKDGFGFTNGKCEACGPDQYSYERSRQSRCESCIPRCSAEENKVEESACTKTSARKCNCMPGFYCPSPTMITCRKSCKPCEAGSFSSTKSLDKQCKIFTDCASKGMVVMKEGSSTQDRECGNPTTTSNRMTRSITTIPWKPAATFVPTTSSIPTTTPIQTTTPPIQTTTPPIQTTTPLIQTTTPKQTTTSVPTTTPTPTSPIMVVPSTTVSASGTAHSKDGPIHSSIYWTLVPWLIVFVLVVACLCMRRKLKTLINKLCWPGLMFGKNQLQHLQKAQTSLYSSGSDCHNMDSGDGVSGQRLCPAGNQQVTMENNGKGESISNTVGSIFIYSPGMVILGSNSKERKEEAEESGEDIPLMSVPQQESSSPPQDHSVAVEMQEEVSKELSYPVPATSK